MLLVASAVCVGSGGGGGSGGKDEESDRRGVGRWGDVCGGNGGWGEVCTVHRVVVIKCN